MADNDLINERQAAEFIGLAMPTLRSWRQRQRIGQPPYYKLCGAIRYKRSELIEWLASNAVSV